MTRPKPLSFVAIAFAGAFGFILLRVFYRSVFGGASSGEILVWSIPRLRLSGPFTHIVLFGPVTAEGLLTAALSALPLAIAILATGILVAAVDVRSLVFLIPRIRWGTAIFVAFVIALSTMPALLETAKRTQYFARVRGISKRRDLFVPFLEKTLERAVGMAKALHSRGFVAREHLHMSHPDQLLEMVEFAMPSRGVAAISWTMAPGSLMLMSGQTGAGKTSVLEAIAGVVNYPHPVRTTGSLDVRCDPDQIAYIPHDPKSLFLASRVCDEIALGLVLRGVSRKQALAVAGQELARWDLSHLSDRHPDDLSDGEAALIAVVSALVSSPRLILLDEPLAVLDRQRRQQVLSALELFVNKKGGSVLMPDHGHVSPATWVGEIFHLGSEGMRPGLFVPPALETATRVATRAPEKDSVLSLDTLTASRGGREVFGGVSLEIFRGESVVITGDNGAGKTTLLETAFENSGPNPSEVAYVPSNPADLFVTETLRAELDYTDKQCGLPSGFTHTTLASLLPGVWREEVLQRASNSHPRDLSRGQQTAVAIAIQMSHKPLVLALDEPTRGLDSAAREALGEVLACVRETGTALLSASHDDDYVHGAHDRVFTLSEGSLLPREGGVLYV